MFLHAWRLQFKHPASGEPVSLQAQLPPDLEAFMQAQFDAAVQANAASRP